MLRWEYFQEVLNLRQDSIEVPQLWTVRPLPIRILEQAHPQRRKLMTHLTPSPNECSLEFGNKSSFLKTGY